MASSPVSTRRCIGGVAVALLMGDTLSLGGLVGFVTLFGISVPGVES